MKLRTTILLVGVLLSAGPSLSAPIPFGPGVQGVVILAERRFDPAVQRFMAERALRALPLVDGQLYYVYPVQASNAQLESMQIQYLEHLIDKRGTGDASVDASEDAVEKAKKVEPADDSK